MLLELSGRAHGNSKAGRTAASAMAELSLKICYRCKRILHFGDFCTSRHRVHGIANSCRDCRSAMASDRLKARRKHIYAKQAEWRRNNPERAKAISLASRRKYLTTIGGRLRSRVSNQINRRLYSGKDGSSCLDLLDFSINELKSHLEKQFLKGMSWANFGQWHIDHIVPLSSFRIESADDEQFRRAWALTNLRPLWAKDNLRKGSLVETLL